MSQKIESMRHGDSFVLLLDYTANNIPLVEFEPDEIEFYFGKYRFLLTEGNITLDQDLNKYSVFIDQEMTFNLGAFVDYQIRIKKGIFVSAFCVGLVELGDTISKEVI